MKTQDLYLNQGKMVESLNMRREMSGLVESFGPHELVSMGIILLDRSWVAEQLEQDLGSSAIEALLDEIENADHYKVESVYKKLKEEGVI
jgi:hypothetical protein